MVGRTKAAVTKRAKEKEWMDADVKYVAICSAGIDEDYNDTLLEAFYSLADTFGFKLLFFNSFSSLYYYEKHDIGESNIFHLMNYELLDGIVLLSETVKNEGVRNEIVKKQWRSIFRS